MKKNCYIGYAISIVSGLIIIASAFLSLTMTSETGHLIQGESLFNILLGGITPASQTMSIAIVFYVIGIALALVEIVCGVVGLILTANNKHSGIYLLIERIVSLVAVLAVIISFIMIGVDLLAIESTAYNFTGFGIVLAILGALLLIEGIFLVRKPKAEEDSKSEE